MRQFDVFANPSRLTNAIAPFVIMLSSHHLRDLSVVVVAPLVRDRLTPAGELEVGLDFDGEALTLPLSDIYSLEQRILTRKRGSLADQEDGIRRGLEKLFTGF